MWDKYELCRVIKTLPGQIIVELLKTEETITVYSKYSNYQVQSIVVYDKTKKILKKYSKELKPLFKEYSEFSKFKNIIKNSKYSEEYMALLQQGTSYKKIYEHIVSKKVDSNVINLINLNFNRPIKISFDLQIPLYYEDLMELASSMPLPVYYLNKNSFYTLINVNILNEKPYTKFLELFKNVPYIDFNNVKS